MLRRCLVLAASLCLMTACTGNGAEEIESSTSPPSSIATLVVEDDPEIGLEWWNDRVFYEIFVRSFKDSDGDGIGDFAGLTDSLDYLNDGDPATTDDLGITGIWLMPIFPSPSYHGYDVTDYRDINPDYGTMEDFEAFLDAAHQRGIAVIIDLVINHSSSEHPWFVAADAGDSASRDWYRWSDTDLGTPGIFTESAWHEGDDGYYFGLFVSSMPDLNLENPDVTAEVRDIARYWLEDVGVDGFRLDAVAHLIEEDDITRDTPDSKEWLAGFTEFVHGVKAEALVLGEVWNTTVNMADYVPDSMDFGFEFGLAEAGLAALLGEDGAGVRAAQERVIGAYPEGQYAPFLSNHDQDRVMSVLGGDGELAKLAAAWLLTSPGIPFLYYGEEVGQEGEGPHERIRTPMPWTGEEPRVGFTSGEPWEKAAWRVDDHNVASQTADPESLLNHYRKLIQARAESPALRHGDLIKVETGLNQVLSYLRSDGTDHVLFVGNLGAQPVRGISLDLAEGPLAGVTGATSIVGPRAFPAEITDRGGFVDYRPVMALPGHGVMVVRLDDSLVAETDEAVDAEVVETFFTGTGDNWEDESWLRLIAPTFRFIAFGNELELYQAGIIDPAEVADWDGDGNHTIADFIVEDEALSSVFRAEVEANCAPDGQGFTCTVDPTDLFYRLADQPGVVTTWRVGVDNGLIVSLSNPEQETGPEVDAVIAAAIEPFRVFEEWVSATYPDRYPLIFDGSCCAGDGSNMAFTPETVAEWESLLNEWAPPTTD